MDSSLRNAMQRIEHNSSAKLVLFYLATSQRPLTRAEIAEDLHLGEATLKRALKLLKEAGLIAETPRNISRL